MKTPIVAILGCLCVTVLAAPARGATNGLQAHAGATNVKRHMPIDASSDPSTMTENMDGLIPLTIDKRK